MLKYFVVSIIRKYILNHILRTIERKEKKYFMGLKLDVNSFRRNNIVKNLCHMCRGESKQFAALLKLRNLHFISSINDK